MTHLSVKTLLGSALALGTVGLFVAPTANADSFTAKVSERAIQKSVENRDRGNRGTRDRVRPDRRTGSVDRDRRHDRVDRDRRRDRTERTVVRRDRIRDNRRVHRDFRRASTRHYRNDYRSPIRRSFHTPYRSGLGISFNFGTPGYSPYRWASSDYAFYRPGRISFANYRTPKTSPIHAYLSLTHEGNNHPVAWFATVWFTIIIWMVGQLIVSVPMIIGIMIVDPDFLNKMPMSDQTPASLVMPGFVLSSAIAITLYLARHGFKLETRPRAIMAAFIAALISTACFIMLMQANDSEANEFLLGYIGQSPLVYASMLLVFPIVTIGLFLGQRFIHERSIKSMLTVADKFRWRRLFFSMIVFWGVAGTLTTLAHLTDQSRAEYVFDISRFIPFLVVSLLLIPLQSATEEIVLRGYLNQGLFRLIMGSMPT